MLFRKRENPAKDFNLMRILLVLFLPYIALSIGQNGFLGLLPFVREEFALTRVQIGYYSTSFFMSAAILAVFTGSFVDKLGAKKSMLLGIGFMGFLLILHGLSPSYKVLLFMAFLAGLGFSIITPSVTKAVITSTPPGKRAVSMGITQTGFGFGGIAGASFLPLLGEILGWRIAIQVAAFFALLTGPFVYKFYREQDNIRNILDVPDGQRGKQQSFKENFLSLFVHRPLFRFCVLGIIFGISEGAVLSHFAVFLSGDLNMSRVTAGLGFGTLHLGGIIGLIGWGWLSDRLLRGDRRLSLFMIGLSSGIMYLLFGLFLNHSQVGQVTVFLLSFLLGFSALGWTGVYLVTIGEFAGSKQAGIATGLALLFARIGLIVAPPIFGFIADAKGYYEYSWLLFGFVIIGISPLFLIRDFIRSSEQII
jgi:sugar phosphate permease